jgi:hypothetical protein
VGYARPTVPAMTVGAGPNQPVDPCRRERWPICWRAVRRRPDRQDRADSGMRRDDAGD